MDIEANLARFIGERSADARYASFDYCFNYFQSFREEGRTREIANRANMQASCLQLGFYLASWGMFRNSTLILKSARHFGPVVEVIATAPSSIWQMDAHCYTDEGWRSIRQLDHRIRSAFHHPNRVSDALATKVLLGAFGNVPAFDTFFKIGFNATTFGPKAFRRIGQFYLENANVIEGHRISTLEFETGAPTHRLYTRAKIIDMIFFIEGQKRP